MCNLSSWGGFVLGFCMGAMDFFNRIREEAVLAEKLAAEKRAEEARKKALRDRVEDELKPGHLDRIHSLEDTTVIERRIESSNKGPNEAVEAVRAMIGGSREGGG